MADLIDRGALAESLFPLYNKDAADIYRIIEDAPSVNRWISVNEKLPEVGQFVLVYYPEWGNDAIQVGMLEYDRLYFDICGEFCFPVNKVTHWMILPEPPEVKDDV